MELTSQTIPAWIVAVVMIYTGLAWYLAKGKGVRTVSALFGNTFLLWGAMYLFFQFLNPDVELRGFLVRIMVLVVCLSQAIPLTVLFIRGIKNGKQ